MELKLIKQWKMKLENGVLKHSNFHKNKHFQLKRLKIYKKTRLKIFFNLWQILMEIDKINKLCKVQFNNQ